jgi:glucan phosphoethanolaminetransferase (alkaline phosphatase superfamily)
MNNITMGEAYYYIVELSGDKEAIFFSKIYLLMEQNIFTSMFLLLFIITIVYALVLNILTKKRKTSLYFAFIIAGFTTPYFYSYLAKYCSDMSTINIMRLQITTKR